MTTPLGPYSPVVRAGDWLVTSGQLGVVDGRLVEGGVEGQMAKAMDNVRRLLESEGATMSDVAKVTIFLAHISDWPRINDPYLAALGDHRPARSAFAVAGLPMGALVEVEAWAHVGS